MKSFFGNDVLLSTRAAVELYEGVKDLPIVDYHCHLNEREIRDNHRFTDIGELWLSGDHYKWRAMRLCDVDEAYITGNASYYEKFRKYAEIFPRLCGNPLYYWTQMELSLLFDIHEPLSTKTADSIWEKANAKLSGMTVGDILKRFRVSYIATTDDPVSPLSAHGTYGDTRVCPTFRPDRMLSMDPAALAELEAVSGISVETLDGFKTAMENRLMYFRAHGCGISDHGMDWLPVADCGESAAKALYARRFALTPDEKLTLSSHLLGFLASLYTREDMVMQLHFATFRNVNSAAFPLVGRDAGYDIIRGEVHTDRLVAFLDRLYTAGSLPRTVLYTLNPSALPVLAAASGAFPRVLIGAAWWFNDTVRGIRQQIETVAEYASLGTNLGMLTDSRSFASYARFDFFRRILADEVGNWVEKGEYDMEAARVLMYDVCYGNAATAMKL